MAENTESTGLLAIIDAKIAALQRLRESVIAAMSVGAMSQGEAFDPSALPSAPGGGSASSFGQQNGALDLPTGVFRDKGLADAIRVLLAAAKRKMPFKEIKTALLQGGLATTAEDFDPTLSGTLNRMKRNGELLAFKEGWDLAASYPEAFRQRFAQAAEPTKTSPKKKGQKRAASKKSAAKPSKPATDTPKSENADKTAVAASVIRSAAGGGVSILELWTAMQQQGAECERKYVRGILNRFSNDGKIEQRGGRGGRYYWSDRQAGTGDEPKVRAV